MFLPHPRVKVSIAGSLRDREVACSASDRQGSNFESCVWRTVSSQSSHHPQEVLLAQFSQFSLKPDSFHLIYILFDEWTLLKNNQSFLLFFEGEMNTWSHYAFSFFSVFFSVALSQILAVAMHHSAAVPVNTWRLAKVGMILGHRLRHWPSIKTTHWITGMATFVQVVPVIIITVSLPWQSYRPLCISPQLLGV